MNIPLNISEDIDYNTFHLWSKPIYCILHIAATAILRWQTEKLNLTSTDFILIKKKKNSCFYLKVL